MNNIDELILEARKYVMTSDERELQRRSFVYGNLHIENSNITREMIKKASDRLNANNNK